MPIRVQSRRERGWRKPDGVVYVGRPTRRGNPIRLPGTATKAERQEAVDNYRRLLEAGDLVVTVADVRHDLRGKDLACWCSSAEPCHADVLLEIANRN